VVGAHNPGANQTYSYSHDTFSSSWPSGSLALGFEPPESLDNRRRMTIVRSHEARDLGFEFGHVLAAGH